MTTPKQDLKPVFEAIDEIRLHASNDLEHAVMWRVYSLDMDGLRFPLLSWNMDFVFKQIRLETMPLLE